MIKKYGIGLLAVAVAVSAVAFTKDNSANKPKYATLYLQYSASAGASEGNYETTGNWTVTTLPGSNPCTAGTNAPCIVHADEATIGVTGGDNNATKISKFVNYLKSLAPLASGASTYVSDPSFYNFQRQ